MKKTNPQDLNLLPVFRTFAVLWLGLMVLMMVGDLIDNNPQSRLMRDWLYIASAGLLVIYLFIPSFEELLGKAYLPLALSIAVVGPMLVFYSPWQNTSISGYTILQLIMSTMRLNLLWLVVAVTLGWAYGLRTVLSFSIGIGIFNTLLMRLINFIPREFELEFFIFSLFITVTTAMMGYLVVRLSDSERQQRRQLIEANEKLVQYANTLENLTISRERNRMARELHDTLAHTLSSLAVQLETTKAVLDSDLDTAKTLLEQSLTGTRSGLQETRQALSALRATPLEDLGLCLALSQLGEIEAKRCGAKLILDIPENLLALPPVLEQTIYRTAQEAIANVVKHATARTLTIKFAVSDTINIVIEDDGVGFDPLSIEGDGHYGLVGMRERAELVKGNLVISSQPGTGTRIELVLPLEEM